MLRFVSAGTNHRMLLANCILEIQSGEVQSLAKDLPESVWDELDHQMEQKDPQADIRMKIKCPACLTDFEAGFDIMNFLWAEINDWAHRILQEVYLLARSYGWSEKDILSMSSRRRHAYREMLRP